MKPFIPITIIAILAFFVVAFNIKAATPAFPAGYAKHIVAEAKAKSVKATCQQFADSILCLFTTADGTSMVSQYWRVGFHNERQCITSPLIGKVCVIHGHVF